MVGLEWTRLHSTPTIMPTPGNSHTHASPPSAFILMCPLDLIARRCPPTPPPTPPVPVCGPCADMGRLNMAARQLKEIAENNEKQGLKDEAITFYEQVGMCVCVCEGMRVCGHMCEAGWEGGSPQKRECVCAFVCVWLVILSEQVCESRLMWQWWRWCGIG